MVSAKYVIVFIMVSETLKEMVNSILRLKHAENGHVDSSKQKQNLHKNR